MALNMPSEIFDIETKLKLYRLHRTTDISWWAIGVIQNIGKRCKYIYAVEIWLLVLLTYREASIYTAQCFFLYQMILI